MINIDKDYLITVDLKNTKVKSGKTIFFYNTDLNICNIFIKLICTDEDKTIPEDLIVEFAVLKPETDEFKPLDATLISKEDLLYQVDLTTDYFDIVGKYSCEIRVSGTIENESKCFTSEEFDYVVRPNITAKLNKKIKNDKNLPILEKLIKDVKEITDGINKNEIQMKRDENLVGDNKTIVGAINQLREDVNSGIGGGTVELKDYQKKNDEFLNTDEKTITGGINEVNNKIKKVQESQIELDKDDVSFNGIDDISHDTLTTTNKTIIGGINEVNSQFKDIANIVSLFQGDNDTIKLQNAINYVHENGGGNIIIDKDINLVDTIIIKDNVNIYSKKSKIVSNTDKIPIIIKGNNVSMNGITINCNKISNVGIYVDSYIRNINITECEVFNIDTEAEAYGIYISSYGCSNIKIHKCNVHDIKSTADGVTAVRGGGWSKGIIIDRAEYVNGDVSKGKDLNTKGIIISENIIENIFPYEDGEAIYIEGNSIKNIVNAKIINNTIKNFGKRAIKILPCSEIIISNNYIENNLEDYNFSFISFFATNITISNNRCIKTNNYIENGIEIGYDYDTYIINEEVGNIIITNNNLICGNTGTNYGIIFKHKQMTTSCIISNNNIQNVRYGIALKTSNIIKNININNNIFNNVTGTAIYNRSNLSTLTVDGNIITGNMLSSAIDINIDDSLENKKIEYIIIQNNFINKTDYAGISISYGDTIKILNNNFYCNVDSVYIDTEHVTNYYVQNTINLKNNKFSKYDTFKEDSNLILINEINTTLIIPTILSKIIIVKYLIANTIDNIVANNGTMIVLTTSNGDLTINNSSDIALKNSTNVTLAFQQSITLIRLDNRWIEISRNF